MALGKVVPRAILTLISCKSVVIQDDYGTRRHFRPQESNRSHFRDRVIQIDGDVCNLIDLSLGETVWKDASNKPCVCEWLEIMASQIVAIEKDIGCHAAQGLKGMRGIFTLSKASSMLTLSQERLPLSSHFRCDKFPDRAFSSFDHRHKWVMMDCLNRVLERRGTRCEASLM
jgi:hypothetical protein